MKTPNKKTIVSIFAGYIFLQMALILALSANFLLAQMNTNTDTTEVKISIADSGDRKNFSASSNVPLSGVMFHFDSTDSTSTVQFPGVLENITKTNWSLNLKDGDLKNNIDYKFYVTGSYAGKSYGDEQNILIHANYIDGSNSTTANSDTSDSQSNTDGATTNPLILSFVEQFESPLFDDRQISISSTQEIYNCVLKIYGPKCTEFPMIKDASNKYHIILHTKDFPDGDYTIKAVAGSNIETAEVRMDIRIKNYTKIESDQPLTTEPSPDGSISTEEPTEEPVESAPTDDSSSSVEPASTESNYPNQPVSDNSARSPYYPESISTQPEQPIIKITPECQEKGLSAEECLKYNQLSPECVDQGASNQEECDRIMSIQSRLTSECKNANITSIEECDRYMMNNFMPEECREANAATKEECDYILRNNYNNYKDLTTKIETPLMEDDIIRSTQKELSPECLNNGINSFEECKKYMMSVNMPEECREANTTTKEECDKIMFKKYGPKECLKVGILNQEKCENYMFEKFAPDDCKNTGISNPEACKKYMFEKYNSAENITQDKFPIECQKANAKTADECEKVMKKTYLPKECEEQGIDNEEKCDLYLRQKHMPKECREAGAQTRNECDKIMFEKSGSPECRKAGIEDEEKCREFMFDKYAPKVECDNLEKWQCDNFIRDRHLGNIVAKQATFGKIKENTARLVGKTVSSEELKEKIGIDEKIILPLKENTKFKIISGEEKLTLNKEDNLIQTAPIILMIDSDMDGLPNGLEKRLGTDPNNADSDGDGYTDGEEVKNKYNPLGEGELKDEISPIDEAILQNKILGHPKTEGEEIENITIENITNLENERGYALSGKSEPNSVVALYIYSDLPLVITTKTDEYGNWQYKLSKPLTDGEHEIYVAINDNTGKVVSKSKPLNFFVKEAKAVSVKDFISPVASAASETEKESSSLIHYYLIAALLLIAVGVLFFVIVIMRKKRAI